MINLTTSTSTFVIEYSYDGKDWEFSRNDLNDTLDSAVRSVNAKFFLERTAKMYFKIYEHIFATGKENLVKVIEKTSTVY